MVRLYTCLTLQNIRPDGSLRQEFHAVQFPCFFREHIDELFADDVSLLLRIADACKFVQETVHCIHIDQVRIHLITENLDDLLGFSLAKQSVVDMNRYQLLADRLDQECRNH